MQQVLLNLLLNALDATPAGGEVGLRLRRNGGWLELEVYDNGRGILPENLGKIFNPFFTTREQGTGLGLANAFRMIEAHGGELSVRSAPGSGSVFTVRLPALED
jgi:two-component system sensor histidine kinase HydH